MSCWRAVVLAAVLTAGCGGTSGAPEVEQRTAGTPPPPPPVQAPFESVEQVSRAPVPVRLRISTLGIDAAVGPVGRLPDGTVEVPARWEDVGWYEGGARPGDVGPAVLLGHVDSRSGPAVFVALPRVTPGTAVEVVGADGTLARFRVDRVESYPKSRFPTDAVYLPSLRPELRLVTCGGEFDRATRHYRDNVVVFASPA